METLAVLKNGVHFTTPELKELGVRYREARLEYEEKQAGLVEKAVETAATYLPLVESASALVSFFFLFLLLLKQYRKCVQLLVFVFPFLTLSPKSGCRTYPLYSGVAPTNNNFFGGLLGSMCFAVEIGLVYKG